MMDYMDQSDGIEACQKRLYLAVINGECVRVQRAACLVLSG